MQDTDTYTYTTDSLSTVNIKGYMHRVYEKREVQIKSEPRSSCVISEQLKNPSLDRILCSFSSTVGQDLFF